MRQGDDREQDRRSNKANYHAKKAGRHFPEKPGSFPKHTLNPRVGQGHF